ncbi:MAG: hypothetical protein O7H41_04050 [Planctomycetota bacterium]|nr:hypothetical protein [Planctomycetota bacterium]
MARFKRVVLGMAKGRAEFKTERGGSGSGKRVGTELDLLRLIYAIGKLKQKRIKAHAYFAVLRHPKGKSICPAIRGWLSKYEARDSVEIIERRLTQQESTRLKLEKSANARAQERRGGSAHAGYAKRLAETALRNHIRKRHPTARPGLPAERPFGINWDALYIVR